MYVFNRNEMASDLAATSTPSRSEAPGRPIHERGRYRKYIRDATAPIPRTTMWNHRTRVSPSPLLIDTSTETLLSPIPITSSPLNPESVNLSPDNSLNRSPDEMDEMTGETGSVGSEIITGGATFLDEMDEMTGESVVKASLVVLPSLTKRTK